MKVSIVTVCYNSQQYISTAIESVLAQSYTNIEYIVIDGDSSDSTLRIIREYGNSIHKVISEPDEGIYDAMNKGIRLATGDIVGILNSDDFYYSTKVIENVVNEFSGNPDIEMLFGNVDFVHPEKLSVPVRVYDSNLFKPCFMRFGFMPAHPGAFIKRSAYEDIGFYSKEYRIGADFEWFVKAVLVHQLGFKNFPHTLVRMRLGGVSTSGLKSYWLSSKDQLRALRNNGFYSNMIFILARLPVKFFDMWLRRLKQFC